MTETGELRKAFNEAKARIEEDSEFVRKSIQRAEAARLRMLKAAGIRTDDGQPRK